MTTSSPSRSTHGLPQAAAGAWSSDAWMDVTVLVGVSGGADSVALVRALLELRQAKPQAKGGLIVAHFHHAVRESADEDQRFVRELAEAHDLPFVTAQRSSLSADSEESLRSARFKFFQRVAAAEGARYVALAHTSDDQVETVLHRIIRGSGLRGLTGIPHSRELDHGVTLIRPLLGVSRAEVIDYLGAIGQEHREDPTNANVDYTRNAIRHALLPLLEEQFNPDVRAAVLRLLLQAQEAHTTLAELAAAKLDVCAEFGATSEGEILVRLRREKLRSMPDYLLRLMLMLAWDRCGWPQQAMGDAEWRRLAALAASSDRSKVQADMFPGGVQVTFDAEFVTLKRITSSLPRP